MWNPSLLSSSCTKIPSRKHQDGCLHIKASSLHCAVHATCFWCKNRAWMEKQIIGSTPSHFLCLCKWFRKDCVGSPVCPLGFFLAVTPPARDSKGDPWGPVKWVVAVARGKFRHTQVSDIVLNIVANSMQCISPAFKVSWSKCVVLLSNYLASHIVFWY